MFRKQQLSDHGESLASYSGSGFLEKENGERIECTFAAGQLNAADVLLICECNAPYPSLQTVTRFVGTNPDRDYEVEYTGDFSVLSSTHQSANLGPSSIFEFHISDLHVRFGKAEPITHRRYGITNLRFAGIEYRDGLLSLPLLLSSGGKERKIYVEGLEGHEETVNRLKHLKGIEPTAEIVINIHPNDSEEELVAVVNATCYLLSVAQGTKIQWVYQKQVAESGRCVASLHYSRFTKRFGGWPTIEPHSGLAMKEFVEKAYPGYVATRKTFKLERGFIDGYLDAKAEGDLLERRAIKLVVVVEMLKAVYLGMPEKPVGEFILEPSQFKRYEKPLRAAIRDVMQGQGVSEEDIALTCEKVKELNRMSFKRILKSMLDTFGLAVNRDELNLFIACRNSLVHSGDFYEAEKTERVLFYREEASPDDVDKDTHFFGVSEFLFLMNFVDKLVLKVMGYSGHYMDVRFESSKHPNAFGYGEI